MLCAPRRLRSAKPLLLSLLCATVGGADDVSSGDWLDAYRGDAQRILAAATAGHSAWERLAELTDRFGPRLAGSPQLEAALRWGADEMRRDGFENVHLEPVQVPHWVRGEEGAVLVEPDGGPLALVGLGNSIGTRPEGLVAEVLVVGSFEEMEARAADVRGRIVLFNVPFTRYGETVRYRGQGPSRAAALGAVGVLIRSVGPMGLRTPHTGSTRYDREQPQIPAAALAAEDANRLQRLQDRGERVVVRLRMGARFLPDATSHNLIAELPGRERPDEIVVLGGHIDSWDVGTGAMDDGGGCVATWQALRLLRALGLQPRRTLRLVWWTNEENGLRGGLDYLKRNTDALDHHVVALESDSGVFRPTGFGFSGAESARRVVERIVSLLAPIGADQVGLTGGGADIGPIVEAGRLPALSLQVDGPYFLYHHTPADTVERLEPDDVAKCVAAIAVMAYVLADLPEPLERS